VIHEPSSARRSSRRTPRLRGETYAWPEAFLPWAVAESICDEAGRYLGVCIPRKRAHWLTEKAEVCFQRNPRFRKQIRSAGNSGMGYLRMYMRHWLASILALERPDLYRALPDSFALGRALPPGRSPCRRNASPLRARRWNPARVLGNRRWQFLEVSIPAAPAIRRDNPRPGALPRCRGRVSGSIPIPIPTPMGRVGQTHPNAGDPRPATPIPYAAVHEYPIC
jgi:hypothetical protein